MINQQIARMPFLQPVQPIGPMAPVQGAPPPVPPALLQAAPPPPSGGGGGQQGLGQVMGQGQGGQGGQGGMDPKMIMEAIKMFMGG